ncbi:MAG: 4-oxalocrotonate tautomerase family protein [Oceanospirillaceae bacterium]|nr:4-oxalocrotonate tautomerase family protein [Oceanospirillaceae bacterium]
MPFINVKITDEAVTSEQKKAIIQGCTQLMVDVLNKDPATTFVLIDEVNTDNWGIGFEQVTQLRKQAKTNDVGLRRDNE